MPGWDEAIRDQIDDGSIQVVGIILEQHPDRCQLFMQWKQMGWPILVDSMNLIGAPLVPLSYLIDESGSVTALAGRARSLDDFLAIEPVEWFPSDAASAPDLDELASAAISTDARSLGQLGAQLLLWGGSSRLNQAIEVLERAVELAPDQGDPHFRLGVAYRRRYESDLREPGDFAAAVSQWGAALDTDPNQYIWRRRIQQYGPRLDKPYPFYDWVDEARETIRARGDEPVDLRVEPRGAEIAQPARELASSGNPENPDPDARIFRDEEGFISVETVVVPHTYGDGRAVRVHLMFRPNSSLKAHWNNEGGGLVVWVDAPEGWAVGQRLSKVDNLEAATSIEVRQVELDLKIPDDVPAGVVTIPAYALYYVCEDAGGVCLYRRQDLEIRVELE